METKLSKVKAAYEAGNYQLALRLAAKFGDLGDQRDAIKSGHECYANAKFYRQLGKDPDALKRAGAAALALRYGWAAPAESAQL